MAANKIDSSARQFGASMVGKILGANWFCRNAATRSVANQQVSAGKPIRHGVSLLEIMISIGVVGIGLLGVAALIPLAHYKAAEGVREDRKALYGKRAFREFFVQGYNRPGSWTSIQLPNVPAAPRPYWMHYRGNPSPQNTIYHMNGDGSLIHQTYCFDPHGVAAAVALNQGQERDVRGQAINPNAFFPQYGGSPDLTIARVPRITVHRQHPSRWLEFRLLQNPSPNQVGPAILESIQQVNSLQPMTIAQADEMFRLRDDLEIETLEDLSRAPYAVTITPGAPVESTQRLHLQDVAGSNIVSVKAVVGGSFSWMATLVPELDVQYPAGPIAGGIPRMSNRYTISVVVFNQRDLTGRYREEVVGQIVNPTVLLGATKQVVLQEMIDVSPLTPEDVSLRSIRQGDWIALLRYVPTNNQLPRTIQLKWYQVVGADAVEGDADQTRELTLSGPDWNPDPTINTPIFAIYLRNVVAVYEKTIELQQ
jgi:hypothetical protein